MKVFRDIVAAVLIGIIGGLFVSTISYYQDHKEGGMKQTMLAVLDSFDTVADAYSDVDGDSLFAGNVDYDLENEVLEAFEKVEDGESSSISGAMLNSLLSNGENSELERDILAMDGLDGNLEQGEPYSEILRFHVRANSDSEEDQELKMAVKEDVVALLNPLLEDCKDVAESKSIIVKNLQSIYETTINTITEQGYDYNIKVYVTEEEFPAKTYGDLTFPDGEYQALRIDIGQAKGQNWWCVMYPPLCFIDESTAVVSKEGKETLKETLTPEEYLALFAYCRENETNEDKKVEIKGESWLYHLIKESK